MTRAQRLLIRLGFDLDPDGADGTFGALTADAVGNFRRDHGLRPLTVIGPRVWELLLKNE